MKRLSVLVLNFIERNSIQKIEDRDILLFGLEIIISSIGDIFAICLIGFIFDYKIEAVIYLFVFAIIKSNAGGYHAKSVTKCFMMTVGIFAGTVLIAEAGIWVYCRRIYMVFIMASNFILAFAPVETIKNKLPAENAKLRRRRILVCIVVLEMIPIMTEYNIKIYFMFMAVIWSGITVLAGKICYGKKGKVR